jgi:integrase
MSQPRLPYRLKRGSVVVTIYRTPSRGCDSFTIAYYDGHGLRCRRTAARFTDARQIASEIADGLIVGEPDVLVLRGQELATYRRALAAVKAAGVALDAAVLSFARGQLADAGCAPAPPTAPVIGQGTNNIRPISVGDVVKELLATKTASGRARHYLSDLRNRLDRFTTAFARPLNDVSAADIERFLHGLTVSARSRNNFRAVIGTLIRFGQRRGYVSKEHPGIIGIDRSSYVPRDVAVFTPDAIRTLLKVARPELVPALAIGAFAGVRSEEIKRLRWEDVRLDEGHIEIRAANAKTKVRRLIPVSPNLRTWLATLAKPSGPISPFSNLQNQFLKLARRARVRWVRNGLRHSYVSYRTAQCGNVATVSLEAGNSPTIIARNYLRCVTPAAAEQWFAVKRGR